MFLHPRLQVSFASVVCFTDVLNIHAGGDLKLSEEMQGVGSTCEKREMR